MLADFYPKKVREMRPLREVERVLNNFLELWLWLKREFF